MLKLREGHCSRLFAGSREMHGWPGHTFLLVFNALAAKMSQSDQFEINNGRTATFNKVDVVLSPFSMSEVDSLAKHFSHSANVESSVIGHTHL